MSINIFRGDVRGNVRVPSILYNEYFISFKDVIRYSWAITPCIINYDNYASMHNYISRPVLLVHWFNFKELVSGLSAYNRPIYLMQFAFNAWSISITPSCDAIAHQPSHIVLPKMI